VARRTYVPGYGYVTQGSRGTSGSVPVRTPSSSGGYTPGAGFTVDTSKAGTGPKGKDKSGKAPTYSTGQKVRYDLTLPIAYDPPRSSWASADRQERQIQALPLVYRVQNVGDLREAYWGDSASQEIIKAAARMYYRGYSNYNDQWAEKFWNEKIAGAALNPGAPAPWAMLQQIFSGAVSADDEDPGGSPRYRSYGGGGGGGGGSSSSVSLTDPTSARGLLMQTMQGILGRDPTNNEYKNFLKVLNEAEMANPRSVEFEGDVAVQSGGIDPGVLALEFAQDQEDFAERQGDQFFRTFMQALAGGV
jgi:hypothetical protein